MQVIIDNVAKDIADGRMLMARHYILFWTPCIIHCINLNIENMAKNYFIKGGIVLARSIIKFIYKHAADLGITRKFIANNKLVCPAIRCCTTNLISLQCLLDCMLEVKRMITSDVLFVIAV